MSQLAFEIATAMAGVAVLSAVVTVLVGKYLYVDRRYEAWSHKNEQMISDLEFKAASLQLRLNSVYEQLLTLGIKLPGPKGPQ